MAISDVVEQIDAEIKKLQQARELLSGTPVAAVKAGRGRPKGSKNAVTATPTAVKKGKRQLSPEGRKAIADAMKRRWAERRKQAAK